MTPGAALTRSKILAPLLMAGLVAIGWVAYRPGLSGGFLFDDFVNLDALGRLGRIDNWAAFFRYITSGTADPAGRPFSLLTFLLDANDWPAEPRPFLRTNLWLHLFNGTLLFLVLRHLGRQLDDLHVRRSDIAATVGAGLWLLHPLLVSTTLYAVQREAMLPGTFVLLALLGWLRGRRLYGTSPGSGLAWMWASILLGTTLAVASKANGVLLPLLVWVVDAVLIHKPTSDRWLRITRAALLVLPSALLAAYLASQLQHLGEPLSGRSWTLEQRLLTEPRVLLDYLRLLVAPRLLSTGLYNDGYAVSIDALHPASTLPAIAFVLALLCYALITRGRAPALRTSLLFFLAGHALEGTTVPLELYFEHRNYIPAMLLFWPLGRAILGWQVSSSARTVVAGGLIALFAVTTWQRATLWGNPGEMAKLWAAQNPTSSRAQAVAASLETEAGRPDLARRRLEPLRRTRPFDLQIVLNDVDAACAMGGVQADDVVRVERALRHAREGDQLVHRWLGSALTVARVRQCPGMDLGVVGRWVMAAAANPVIAAIPGRRQDIHSLLGEVLLAEGRRTDALLQFNLALDARPTPSVAAMQAAMLASAGCHIEALAHLDHFSATAASAVPATGWNMQRVHARVLADQNFWPRELSSLRQKIARDVATTGMQQ